jgi:hypothetical protein
MGGEERGGVTDIVGRKDEDDGVVGGGREDDDDGAVDGGLE